jgi:Ca-activated chloride channel homolog
VEALDVNSIPEGGTAIAEAINTALTAFKEGDHYKALVLLTDGEDNDEGALEAAQNAAKEGLKIFTVGIGTTEGTLVTVKGADGNTDYIRDEKGQVVKSKLNESLLQQIATATGGFYLPLRGADTMDILYDKGLSLLPKSEGTGRTMRRFHEQYHCFLALAMLLLIAEMLFPERKTPAKRAGETPPQVQGPKSKVQSPSSPMQAVTTALLIGLLFLPLVAKASPTSALRQYNSGDYTNALNEYTRIAEVQTNDIRLIFNAGDAAYRATNFDLAQNLFTQVTLSPDLKLQQKAFYNLGNTQFQQAKLAKDLDGLQEGLETAEKTYQRAVMLNTNDADAMFNWNFTKQAIEQIKAFKEAMRHAKSDADAAVRRSEFHRALEIMMPLQKTIAAKQFQDFTKKLKDIDDIQNPQTSTPPQP